MDHDKHRRIDVRCASTGKTTADLQRCDYCGADGSSRLAALARSASQFYQLNSSGFLRDRNGYVSLTVVRCEPAAVSSSVECADPVL